jgi:hypothetical protein
MPRSFWWNKRQFVYAWAVGSQLGDLRVVWHG